MERTLKYKIVGDASGNKALKETEAGLGSLGIVGSKAAGIIGAVQGKLNGLGPVGRSASGGINSIISSAQSMGPAVMGGAAVAIAGLGLLAKMTKAGVGLFQQYVGQAKQVQRITGASAEDSSRWADALRKVNIDVETGSKALVILAKNVAGHSEKLTANGIEIAKNKQGQTDLLATVLNVSDAYLKAEDPAKRIKIVTDAFGKSGAALIPILAKGRDGIKEFFADAEKHHMIFSQKDFDDAKAMALASKNLKEAWQGMEIELGRRVVPAITFVTQKVTGGVETIDRWAHAIGGANKKLEDATGHHNLFGTAVKVAVGVMVPAVGVTMGLAKAHDMLFGSSKKAGDGLTQVQRATINTQMAMESLAKVDPLGGIGKNVALGANTLTAQAASLGESFTQSLLAHIDGDKAKADWLKQFDGISKSIASSLDVGDAWKKLEDDGKASIHNLNAALEQQIKDLGAWHENLVAIAARGGTDFARELEHMGPEAAGLVAKIRTSTDVEFDRLASNFGAKATLSGTEFAVKLDKQLEIAHAIARSHGVKTATELATALQDTIHAKKSDLIAMIESLANDLHLRVAADITTTVTARAAGSGTTTSGHIVTQPKPGQPKGKGFDSGGILPPGATLAVNKTGHDEWVIDPADVSSPVPVPRGRGGVAAATSPVAGVQIVFTGSIHLYGAGGVDEFIRKIRTEVLKGIGRGNAGLS